MLWLRRLLFSCIITNGFGKPSGSRESVVLIEGVRRPSSKQKARPGRDGPLEGKPVLEPMRGGPELFPRVEV
jgi:hypothetical protein